MIAISPSSPSFYATHIICSALVHPPATKIISKGTKKKTVRGNMSGSRGLMAEWELRRSCLLLCVLCAD